MWLSGSCETFTGIASHESDINFDNLVIPLSLSPAPGFDWCAAQCGVAPMEREITGGMDSTGRVSVYTYKSVYLSSVCMCVCGCNTVAIFGQLVGSVVLYRS